MVVEYHEKRRGQSELDEVCTVVVQEAQQMCCNRFDQASQVVYRHLVVLHGWLCSISETSLRVLGIILGE